MQTYSYTPLAKHEIRLLGIQQNTAATTISATLKSFSRTDAPEYFCLSYTWGTGVEDSKIQIDGHAFYVRPSLVEILHRLQEELAVEGSDADLNVQWVFAGAFG